MCIQYIYSHSDLSIYSSTFTLHVISSIPYFNMFFILIFNIMLHSKYSWKHWTIFDPIVFRLKAKIMVEISGFVLASFNV